MSKKLIIPKRLKKGDSIGFISPSSGLAPFAMHRIEQAVKTFEKLGYKVKMAKNALKNKGYVSASIKERVEDLHSMFRDREIKMIMTTIGGYNSNSLLKYLDYDLIRKNPKIFIGYSDITVLHYALQAAAGLATYYGPCAMTQFGEYPKILPYTLENFNKEVSANNADKGYEIIASKTWTEEILDWFKKLDTKRARKLRKNNGYYWWVKGKAQGELLGGAIPSINHLAGTKYWIEPKDKIFFLDIPESSDINHGMSLPEVEACLADLDNLGVFNDIVGLIIGRPYHCSSDEKVQLKEIVLSYLKNKKCPTLYNANIGHTDPINTLRYGAMAELDSRRNSFRIID